MGKPPESSDSSDAANDEFDAAGTRRLIVPGITNDAIEGHPDRLGVDADAQALAALVASRRLEPPLAIGLYAEWGSGKTFFMKRVEACVRELAASGLADDFCSGIQPVWFSAWHYAEGNLWASLLQNIFDTLHGSKSKYEVTLDKLMAEVQSAQQVTSAAAAEVKAATARRNNANKAIKKAKKRHQEATQEASELRTKDLWDAIKLSAEDQHLKEQVTKAASDLGLTVAANSAEDLVRATSQVVGLASRARVLATSGRWYRSPLAYAIYAALIVSSLGLLLGALVHTAHEWMGTAIATVAQLAAIGSAAAGWIIRQGGLARRIIAPAETLQRHLEERLAELQAKNERELAELEQKADAARTELDAAIQQGIAAEERLADAKKEQEELTGERLLRRYLAERANSGDYEHYMGVVALAHRDLRDLEKYLRAACDSNDGQQKLDRIVLYIDDLDRCDPDAVADVLDAVHLLLALQLFVVIVGVDPRWLKQSLRMRHPALLESAPADVTCTSPTDYLEKIFQLTYSLPRMTADSCANLLAGAAKDAQAPLHYQDQHSGDRRELIGADSVAAPVGSGEPAQTSSEYLAEALTMSESDIDALQDVAPLVATSPRRAKRFLNIYLVIRARALGDPRLRELLNSNGDLPDFTAGNTLLVLVALLLGLPKAMTKSIGNITPSDAGQEVTFGAWISEAIQAVPEEEARFQAFLDSRPSIETMPIDAIMRWLPLVRPYLPLGLQEL